MAKGVGNRWGGVRERPGGFWWDKEEREVVVESR